MKDIQEIRNLVEMMNAQATELQNIIGAQLEREDSLMTQKQMSDAIMLIGDLTIATAGLAIGQLLATAENTAGELDGF